MLALVDIHMWALALMPVTGFALRMRSPRFLDAIRTTSAYV